MKKNFFKWAVAFTALATALSFSSCGDDDDDDPVDNGTDTEEIDSDKVYSFTINQINVEEGKTYVYSLENLTAANFYNGEFTVKSVKAGEVVLNIKGNDVTLSDAGASYLSTDFKEMKQAEAIANPENVLFCLLAESTTVSSAQNASKAEIASGANEIYFAEK